MKVLGWGVITAIPLAAAGIFWGFLPGYVEGKRNNVIDHEAYAVSASTQMLHDDMIIGDMHADSLLWNRNLTKRGSRGQADLPRLQEGNVALQVFTSVTKSPSGQNYESNSADSFDNITPLAIAQAWPVRTWGSLKERALHHAQRLHDFEERSPEMVSIIKSRADLDAHLAARAAGSKAIGGILGLEGAHALEGDLENLSDLWDAGFRLMGLHHFFDNAFGGSLHGKGGQGLSELGRALVVQIDQSDWIIDLAHSSEQVVRDVLALTDTPLVVSHSGIHGVCPVKRNLPDALMQQVAEAGGIIGIGYWAEVTCGDFGPDGIARMIVAAIDVVGEDHVALGSDFDGAVETAFDASELAALTQALRAQNVPDDQIRKVMGMNMLRVLSARLPATSE
ncbi:MAG: membrane dipeptidase [Sulfitobacter sp.]